MTAPFRLEGDISALHTARIRTRDPPRGVDAPPGSQSGLEELLLHTASIYSHLCRFESEIPSVMEKYIFSRLHGGGGGTTNK